MAGNTYGPGEVALLGEAIYREHVQKLVNPAQKGSFVVIDVESGDHEVDPSDGVATRRLLERRPSAVTYAIRVGYLAAYDHLGELLASRADG